MKIVQYSIIFGVLMIICLLYWHLFVKPSGQYVENFDLQIQKNIVQIVSKAGKKNHTHSFGYKIDENTIVTSLHAVNSDVFEYEVAGEKWYIGHKNPQFDTAFLYRKKIYPVSENLFSKANVGDEIFVFVWRDGVIKKIVGNVVNTNVYMMGFLPNGQTQSFTTRILTNIDFYVGESGTPIFHTNGDLVDVVHVSFSEKMQE